MASSNSHVTKASVINTFINRVVNPAYNSCVYWNGYNPGTSRINTGALGPRDVERPGTGSITTVDINGTAANNIVAMAHAYAFNTTVYRRARHGLMTDGATVDDSTHICRLHDGYRIGYTYSAGSLASLPRDVNAAMINGFFDAIRNIAKGAQLSAGVVDLRVCHSSCHNNCHSSRGRR